MSEGGVKFEEYHRLIMKYLERFDAFEKEVRETLKAQAIQQAERHAKIESDLRNKASLWAAFGAALPVALGIIWWVVTH